MGRIKNILKKELNRSLKLRADCKKVLQAKPAGSLVQKEISGNTYYYVAFRDNGKVRFEYKGKTIPRNFVAELRKSKELRKKYKGSLKELNAQIQYLVRQLNSKKDI